MAAGYVLYSCSTELVFTLGRRPEEGTRGTCEQLEVLKHSKTWKPPKSLQDEKVTAFGDKAHHGKVSQKRWIKDKGLQHIATYLQHLFTTFWPSKIVSYSRLPSLVRRGVVGFTLDSSIGEYVLTRPSIECLAEMPSLVRVTTSKSTSDLCQDSQPWQDLFLQ